MVNLPDDISVHVYRGYKLMDIYDKTTGFPRLDNELLRINDTPDESRFRFITEEMVTLYSKKNADYGDAFTESLDENGLLVSKIRIKDKLNRFSQLINNDALVNDESMRDTLIDLANYTVMTLMWLDENE